MCPGDAGSDAGAADGGKGKAEEKACRKLGLYAFFFSESSAFFRKFVLSPKKI